MSMQPVYIAGEWKTAQASGEFHATNPQTGEALPETYPVSSWEDCDAALDAAAKAFAALRGLPAGAMSDFLEKYAVCIEQNAEALVSMAHQETGLPASPRLGDVELPRTTGQLRQAAAAAREGSWALPSVDTQTGIRSALAAIGPVCVFGPNNFPFAFNSIAGGDFAAAVAAGNPVIAKANSSHPGTTRLFAEAAHAAAEEAGLPPGTVQLLYRTSHADGERLVADPRVGATGYTGSRHAGLKLKAAADAAGKPIYLELSSINPVVILPGALRERLDQIAEEFTTSCLMGTGQFCTQPGLIVLIAGPETDAWIETMATRLQQAPVGTLLSQGVAQNLAQGITTLREAGAELVTGGEPQDGPGFRYQNTLLRVTGTGFLTNPAALQTEAFGNCSLCVVAKNLDEAGQVLASLEGNLTGCIYSHAAGEDDDAYARLEPELRLRVGRLLNDKMPTGVAVSPAMNHGGPYPATGHPGFTAVGIPATLRRFAMLQCYDNVRSDRLPLLLRDKNPTRQTWRCIDGTWTTADVGG